MDKRMNLADLERENERLRRQLAELDELPGRKSAETISGLKGIRDIPTCIGNKIHTVPPTKQDDRYYLDLYLLQLERMRLVKESASLKRRRLQIGMNIANIDKGMAEKQEKALADMTMLSGEPTTGKMELAEKTAKEKASGKKQEASKRNEYKEEEWNTLILEY